MICTFFQLFQVLSVTKKEITCVFFSFQTCFAIGFDSLMFIVSCSGDFVKIGHYVDRQLEAKISQNKK